MARMKHRVPPASTPGMASGKSARRKVVKGPAPRLRAASSTERSMPSITLWSVSTTKGRLIATMPTITAPSVYMRVRGVPIRPRPPRTEFRNPLLPNITIQPAARTAFPTKSGSTTRSRNRFLCRLAVRASQYATGKPRARQVAVTTRATRRVRASTAT